MSINKPQEHISEGETGLTKELKEQYPITMNSLKFGLETTESGSIDVRKLYEQNDPWFNGGENKKMNFSDLELQYIQMCTNVLEKELKTSASKMGPLKRLLDLLVKDNVNSKTAQVITGLYSRLLGSNQ